MARQSLEKCEYSGYRSHFILNVEIVVLFISVTKYAVVIKMTRVPLVILLASSFYSLTQPTTQFWFCRLDQAQRIQQFKAVGFVILLLNPTYISQGK